MLRASAPDTIKCHVQQLSSCVAGASLSHVLSHVVLHCSIFISAAPKKNTTDPEHSSRPMHGPSYVINGNGQK